MLLVPVLVSSVLSVSVEVEVPVLKGTEALLAGDPPLCFMCFMNSFHLLEISKYSLIGNQGWETYVMPSGGMNSPPGGGPYS